MERKIEIARTFGEIKSGLEGWLYEIYYFRNGERVDTSYHIDMTETAPIYITAFLEEDKIPSDFY